MSTKEPRARTAPAPGLDRTSGSAASLKEAVVENLARMRARYPDIATPHDWYMALAHTVSDKLEAAYRRGNMLAKRVRMMQDWAKWSAKPLEKDNVVPMKNRRQSVTGKAPAREAVTSRADLHRSSFDMKGSNGGN